MICGTCLSPWRGGPAPARGLKTSSRRCRTPISTGSTWWRASAPTSSTISTIFRPTRIRCCRSSFITCARPRRGRRDPRYAPARPFSTAIFRAHGYCRRARGTGASRGPYSRVRPRVPGLMARESADGYFFRGSTSGFPGWVACCLRSRPVFRHPGFDQRPACGATRPPRGAFGLGARCRGGRAARGPGCRDGTAELFDLLETVSERRKREDLAGSRTPARAASRNVSRGIVAVADFSRNTRAWEHICVVGRSLVERGAISNGDGVLALLAFLIRKAPEGDDHDLQLYISRSVASVCGALDGSGRGRSLKTSSTW